MTKCLCGEKIVKLKIKKEEGQEEELWIHPYSDRACQYSDEGIQINVVDPLIQKKFKELLTDKENWFEKTLSKFRK